MAEQEVQQSDPSLLRIAEQVAAWLDVPTDAPASDVVATDTLIACGIDRQLDSACVATCSARFDEQDSTTDDALVVLVGGAGRLAKRAGLIVERGEERLFGRPAGVLRPMLTLRRFDLDALRRQLASRFTLRTRSAEPAVSGPEIKAGAWRLAAMLGRHSGQRRRANGLWTSINDRPLEREDLENHLRGNTIVAPLHCTGHWPWVVVDVDRHNARQEVSFDATMELLQRHLPDGVFVQSSGSRGVHVYVAVPPGFTYRHAALVVRVGLGERFAAAGMALHRYVEVPTEPPRLPFAPGSWLLDVADGRLGLLDELTLFERRLKEAGATQTFLNLRDAIPRRQRTLRGLLTQRDRQEVRGLAPSNCIDAEWEAVWPTLTLWERVHASRGILEFGTRTRVTGRLVSALVNNGLSRDEVERAMRRWLVDRTHQSVDLAEAPEWVLDELPAAIDLAFARRKGIPVRLWATFVEIIEGHLERRPSVRIPRRQIFDLAWRIVCLGYRQRSRVVQLSFRWRVAQAGEEHAASLLRLLSDRDVAVPLLAMHQPPRPDEHGGIYRIAAALWPIRPGEPVVTPHSPEFRAAVDEAMQGIVGHGDGV